MILDYALLADDATTAEGRLYIHGGALRVLVVPQIPWVMHFSVVARFTAELDEAGNQHTIAMRIFEPDGQPVYPLDATEITLSAANLMTPDDDELQLLGTFRVSVLILRETGWYFVELGLDGERVALLPYRVQISD